MSTHMLHIIAPSYNDDVAALVGDLTALHALRHAINDAIESGSGGAYLTQSDGEYYVLTVVRGSDMTHVATSYSREVARERSLRETMPLRAVHGMLDAVRKSLAFKPAGDGLGACSDKEAST